MRKKTSDLLERIRLVDQEMEMFGGTLAGHHCGAFMCRRQGTIIKIIASDGEFAVDGQRWEHVSVSTPNRCPTWEEMCWVKDLFWEPEETVIQLHPPKSQWISNMRYCLHLWRSLDVAFPLPPPVMVGDAKLGELSNEKLREHWLSQANKP